MLYIKKRKRYSRKALRNRRRRIRDLCINIIIIMIIVGVICIAVIEVKNNLEVFVFDENTEDLYEEVYVINVSTEEQVSQEYLAGRVERSSLRTNMSPDLVLVNKQYCLPENYEVSLHMLKNGQQVASLMYEDLRNMLFTGEKEEDVSFIVSSGYRDEKKQNQLLQDEINKNMGMGMAYDMAKEDALLTIAPAGHSEHETGLAVDIVAETNQRLDDTQECTRENQWLQENCYKYGFILRYPKGKEDITGFSYESWHFRYVGKEAAREITEQGITLEEYLE